jgi:hypothetical protein
MMARNPRTGHALCCEKGKYLFVEGTRFGIIPKRIARFFCQAVKFLHFLRSIFMWPLLCLRGHWCRGMYRVFFSTRSEMNLMSSDDQQAGLSWTYTKFWSNTKWLNAVGVSWEYVKYDLKLGLLCSSWWSDERLEIFLLIGIVRGGVQLGPLGTATY